jgi:cytochrome P450
VHGHPEALAVLHDHQTYSSRVSAHLSIPSGMDPPEHTRYRPLIERYFQPDALTAFEPHCRHIVAEAVEAVVSRGEGEAMTDWGEPCAVEMQRAFMGWPREMTSRLSEWQAANARATHAGDASRTRKIAEDFSRLVIALLDERRHQGEDAPDDLTTRLLRERVDGRPLTDEELVSIIRNWTVGELGSIAAAIGILVHAFARDGDLQAQLKEAPERIPAAIDEILRVRGPLVSNRRVATRATELAGQRLEAGDRIRILWPSVNRDERVFEDATQIRLARDPSNNLLYGTGIHVCPGAPLARLELRVFVEELLNRTTSIALDPTRPVVFATPPKGGFECVPFVAHR